MEVCGYNSPSTEELLKKKNIQNEQIISNLIEKTMFIYENRTKFYEELIKNDFIPVYEDIDLPLTYVLSDMEYTDLSR